MTVYLYLIVLDHRRILSSSTMDPSFLSVFIAFLVIAITCFIYYFVVLAIKHPLQKIAGPPKKNWFHCQLDPLLE